jgi:hypothetical protein
MFPFSLVVSIVVPAAEGSELGRGLPSPLRHTRTYHHPGTDEAWCALQRHERPVRICDNKYARLRGRVSKVCLVCLEESFVST